MNKKPLTEKEKIKIANILERTEAGTLDFVSMMIEMHTMGVKATEDSSQYKFKWDYIKPQIKMVMYGERIVPRGEKYPYFSQFLMDKIWQFEDEVITPWFFKAFKVVSAAIDQMGLDWDSEYNHDFNSYTGHLTDQMIEVLDENDIPTFMFGMWKPEETENEEMEVEDAK